MDNFHAALVVMMRKNSVAKLTALKLEHKAEAGHEIIQDS